MAQSTYWIGGDGNIYYGSGQAGAPVQNLGSSTKGQFEARADGLYDKFTDTGAPALTYAAQQIADPSGGGVVAGPSAPSGGNKSAPVLNTGAISATQATIDQIPGLLEAALAAEGQNYGNTVADFNAQEQGQKKTYDESTTTNQLNYDANFMDSIRSGIKGLGGLMSLLRGTGAGGGTAEEIARETVGGVTSSDIRAGADTQKENQVGLDDSLGSFLTDLKRKRDVNEDTRVNNERAIRRDSQTQLQDLFGKMAGYYGDAERTTEANDWMGRAAAITPEIAANSRSQVSAYDTSPIAVKAPEITAFAGPTAPSVQVGDSGQVGTGIFTISDRKREKNNSRIPVPVGA